MWITSVLNCLVIWDILITQSTVWLWLMSRNMINLHRIYETTWTLLTRSEYIVDLALRKQSSGNSPRWGLGLISECVCTHKVL